MKPCNALSAAAFDSGLLPAPTATRALVALGGSLQVRMVGTTPPTAAWLAYFLSEAGHDEAAGRVWEALHLVTLGTQESSPSSALTQWLRAASREGLLRALDDAACAAALLATLEHLSTAPPVPLTLEELVELLSREGLASAQVFRIRARLLSVIQAASVGDTLESWLGAASYEQLVATFTQAALPHL